MAQAFVTGPCLVYLNPKGGGLNGTTVFLGTGEVAPTSEIRHEWEPVMNDLTGSRVPYDEIYEGSHAFTVVDLTRWNENVLRAVEAVPNRIAANVRGAHNTSDIGALMISQNLSYQLWIQYLNADQFANASGGPMPGGLHFFCSWMMGPAIRTTGTRANKVHCVWRHLKAFNPAQGVMTLFDENMAAVAGIPMN